MSFKKHGRYPLNSVRPWSNWPGFRGRRVNGYISVEKTGKTYGVVIDPQTFEVDDKVASIYRPRYACFT